MGNALVIIPTFNERENIEKLLRHIFSLQVSFDVLIVDDGSPDGTADIVRSLHDEFSGRLHLLEREGKQGLGTAYITGFLWALARDYEFIFEMDADFSHNPEDLIVLYNTCLNGADMAIGSRYKSGVNVVNWPMGRVLMSYFASVYVRFVTGMKIYDTTAGFKCYRQKVLASMDLNKIRFKGYAFQIEMKFIAWKMGFRIEEVPIIFTDWREANSKMSGAIFNEALWGVLLIKLRTLLPHYKREKA